MIRVLAAAAALALALAAPASAQDAPAVRHDVELRLDPAAHRLQATDRIALQAGGPVEFRLLAPLEVARLSVDGETRPIRREGDTLRIDLGEAGAHTVEIAYAGPLPPGRLNARAGAVVQPEGTFLPPHGGWLPRGAAERIAYQVAVSVPAGHVALATGAEVASATSDGRRRSVFEAAYPSEGPAVFAGPYAETRREVGGVVLRTLFPRERADGGTGDLAERYLDRAGRYLAHYRETIGPYPYPAFSVIAAPFPVGLGFEGATYVSERILDLPYMRGRSLAHEILHSWWGGAVAIDYARGNWAEGLTTYQADHWVTAQDGPAAAAELRRQWLRDFAALPESRRKPLTAFTGKAHDADQVTGYNKAAMLFHMLRRRLGEAAFRAGLAAFYDRHRYARAGWTDLQAAFEAAGGAALDKIFRQWLERPGAPALTLENAERSRSGDGWQVALRLGQDQPPYDLAVPVAIETTRGTATTTIPLTRATTDATLSLDAEPVSVTVDPDADVFRRLPAGQVPLTLRHLTLDPRTRVVPAGIDVEAAKALAGGLLDTEPRTIAADTAVRGDAPLLVLGTSGAVAGLLGKTGFDGPPDQVAGQGTARVWTAERRGRRVLAIAGRNADALRRAAPATGYHLRRSWLVLDGREVIDKGTWPTGPNPLQVAFRPANRSPLYGAEP